MKRLVLILGLGAVLAGCDDMEDFLVRGPRPGGERVVFACENNTRITVRFPKDQAVLTTPDGATVVLKQGPAADGFFYQGHGHQLRGRGREVDWTPPDGQPRACQRT